MYNICTEGTEDQSVTYPSGEALGSNVHTKRSKLIIKYPQQYDPGSRDDREWKSCDVAIIFYMIQDGDLNINVDMDDILLLMD